MYVQIGRYVALYGVREEGGILQTKPNLVIIKVLTREIMKLRYYTGVVFAYRSDSANGLGYIENNNSSMSSLLPRFHIETTNKKRPPRIYTRPLVYLQICL